MTSSMKMRLAALGLAGLALAAGVEAVDVVAPMLNDLEANRLVVYHDSLGIPTGCEGVTAGMAIGMVLTKAECDEKNAQARAIAAATVEQVAPGIVMPKTARAAFISFVYNVGPGKKGRKDGFVRLKSGMETTMLRKLKAGDIRGACEQLRLWANAGGKPCKFTKGQKNGCYGVYLRRERERKLCISEL